MDQDLCSLFLHSKTLKTFAASSYIIEVLKLQYDLESYFSQYLINKLSWKSFLLDLLIKILHTLGLGQILLTIIGKEVCMCMCMCVFV